MVSSQKDKVKEFIGLFYKPLNNLYLCSVIFVNVQIPF